MSATVTADGITDRPDYGYTPPDSFLNGGPPPAAGPGVRAVTGLREGEDTREAARHNIQTIQAAIDAAHNEGGGLVVLPAGTFAVTRSEIGNGSLFMKDNVFLQGAGMGETVLEVSSDTSAETRITGIVRTTVDQVNNYGIADVTLDGNRDARGVALDADGKEIHTNAFYSGGQAISGNPARIALADQYHAANQIQDEDVYILRTEAQNNSGYGFDPHERTVRLLIADSEAHHNGLDGFVADYAVDSVYRNNLAYENDRHGFNIGTTTNDFLMLDNVARANGSSGIVVQQGSLDIAIPYNIRIEGGLLEGNRGEGIKIREANDVLVTGVRIVDSGTYGVRVKGGFDITIEGNEIVNSSQNAHNGYASIRIGVERVPNDDRDAVHDPQDARDVLVTDNLIIEDGLTRARYAIQVDEHVLRSLIGNNDTDGQLRGMLRDRGQDTLVVTLGTDDAESLVGTDSPDWLMGLDGDDILAGGDGDDRLEGGAGSDRMVGGDGEDTAVIDGALGTGRLTLTGGRLEVRGPDGERDTVTLDVERVELDDARIALARDDEGVTATVRDLNGDLVELHVIDADGERAVSRYENDALVSRTRTDLEDDHAWSTIETTHAANGHTLARSVVYDDGRMAGDLFEEGRVTLRILTDDEDAHAWDRQEVRFDDEGARTARTVTYDDEREATDAFEGGALVSRTLIDVGDAHDWQSVERDFGADGATGAAVAFDDGRRAVESFEGGIRTERLLTDGNDAYGWSRIEVRFDAAGDPSSAALTMDDGRTGTFAFENGERTAVVWDDLSLT